MPQLRVHAPQLSIDQKRAMAAELTRAVLRALEIPDEHRDRCTVQFVPFSGEDVAVGGQLVADGQAPELRLELAAPDLTRDRKATVAAALTQAMLRLLGWEPGESRRVNVAFGTYDARDFAVGGRLLTDWLAQRRAA